MKVDSYSLLGVFQSINYCAGIMAEAGRTSDSQSARTAFLNASGILKNTADDIRMMFDKQEEGGTE